MAVPVAQDSLFTLFSLSLCLQKKKTNVLREPTHSHAQLKGPLSLGSPPWPLPAPPGPGWGLPTPPPSNTAHTVV